MENNSTRAITLKGLSEAESEPQTDGSNAQLEAIFQAFPDLLFCMDGNGAILSYHAGDPTLLYTAPKQFVHKNMLDILPPDLGRQFSEVHRNILETHQIGKLQYQLVTSKGERWFEARMVPSTRKQVVVIVRDITEFMQMKERTSLQLRQLAALYRVDTAITSSFNLSVTLSVILGEIVDQLGVDAADILLFNPGTKMLEFAAGKGFLSPHSMRPATRVGEGYAGRAVLERRTVSIANFDSHGPEQFNPQRAEKDVFISYNAVPMISKGQVKGALEIYHRTVFSPSDNWLEFLSTLASRVAVAIDNAALFENLQKANTELSMAHDAVIESWSQALEISGRESRHHIQNVVCMTLELAQHMNIQDSELVHIRRGALLHDVGNMGIPENILNKPGPLNDEEWRIIKTHPKLAGQMLSSASHFAPALSIPLHHHEHWDGSGYPAGLKGEQVPLSARIFSVVDVFDALTSPRPYRPAWPRYQALNHIREQAGRKFDPQVVKTFLEIKPFGLTGRLYSKA